MDITLFPSKDNLYFKEISSKKDLLENPEINGYLISADEKTTRAIIESLKNKKEKLLIAVSAKDDFFNRRMIETCKINYLLSPEFSQEKDTLKQRSSGFNHVLAKEAVKKGIAILINFSELCSLNKKDKAIVLARIMQNIKICRKTKCKIKIATFAKNKEEQKTEQELKAFLFSLGASSQQVADACKFEQSFISPFTIAEIMIICKRENIPTKETLMQISRITKLENLSWDIFLKSCDFIEKGATIFDSLLMAICSENDQIISSDNIYEKFGFDVIDLKKV